MFDDEVLENAAKVSAGERTPSLKELQELMQRLMMISFSKKVDENLMLGTLKALVSAVDADDDDEVAYVLETVQKLQNGEMENPLQALDILAENDFDFTEVRYCGGSATNIRDYLLERAFSFGLVEKLSQLGVDLNEPVIKGKTPAFITADRDVLRQMPWDKSDREEDLAKAAAYFSIESMEALNADGTSAAHKAVRKGHYKLLQAMLEAGVDVNLTEDQPSVAGSTLLHAACEYGFPEMVQLLMDKGADDTLKNVQEETAAHIAVSQKIRFKKITEETRADMIKALKNVDIPGKNGTTPLMTAQDYDLHASYLLTPVFIEKGADVNRVDNRGNTALMLHLEWSCYKDVVKAMVNAGYQINAQNAKGDTILHLVIQNKNSEVARYLLKKGADYELANEKQVTPLQLAVEKGLDEVLPFMGM